MSKMTNSYK